MPNDLGIKSSTVTAFLNDKLTPEQCKELQKIMNLDPKLYRKYSFIEARSKTRPQISKTCPKIEHTINKLLKN